MFAYIRALARFSTNENTFAEWWYQYGDYVYISVFIVLSILFFGIMIFGPSLSDKLKEKEDEKKLAPKPTVTINLYGFQTLSLSPDEPFFPDIPDKSGYSFQGWFYDPSFTKPFIPGKKIKKDITLYPKWVKE